MSSIRTAPDEISKENLELSLYVAIHIGESCKIMHDFARKTRFFVSYSNLQDISIKIKSIQNIYLMP